MRYYHIDIIFIIALAMTGALSNCQLRPRTFTNNQEDVYASVR